MILCDFPSSNIGLALLIAGLHYQNIGFVARKQGRRNEKDNEQKSGTNVHGRSSHAGRPGIRWTNSR